MDIVGNGLAFWKTMPIARRTATTSTRSSYTSVSSTITLPVARAPGISSCMRLMQRTSVDLPQPDGPISAVTLFGSKLRDSSFTACWSP